MFNYAEYTKFRVEPAGCETYYDFHVPIYENYLACGLIHHNSGKSVMLANWFAQYVSAGYGSVLVEKEGSLFYAALDAVPKERMDDVIALNLADKNSPLGFNILSEGRAEQTVDNLVELFLHLYGDANTIWTQEVLQFGLLTIMSRPELTFIDLAVLLHPRNEQQAAWGKELIREQHDDEVQDFWHRFTKLSAQEQERYVRPVLSRIWQLSRSGVKNVLGQSTSSFTMRDVLEGKKILLVNVAASTVGDKAANLFATLLINSLWQAAKSARHAEPVPLFLDEFQDFLSLPLGMEDMLAKARKYNLSMFMANQNLGQIKDKSMRDGLMSNAKTKAVFRLPAEDAATMAKQFGSGLLPEHLMNIPSFNLTMQLAQAGGVSPSFTAKAPPPLTPLGHGRQIQALSRERYGRPIAQVEAEIEARRQPRGRGEARRRPNIGTITQEA